MANVYSLAPHMPYTLSLNTNPLVNRFAEADDLIETIAEDIGIRDVQLTHEFINPDWPADVIQRRVRDFNKALNRTGVRISSGMTGPYGRLNHFGHPDADIRRYHVRWFKDFADIIAQLGGKSIGTQFAIFTYKDFDDPRKRESLIDRAIECWQELAEYGKKAGLNYLFWEPMSVAREFGHTVHSCLELQQRISALPFAIPLWMMADIDHGDISSDNPDDYDPYAWARSIPRYSPIIHIKQSLMDKGGHRPFTDDHNLNGRIVPEQLLSALDEGGGENNELCLELSFKEREPDDRQVINQIAESVQFWSGYIETGRADLRSAARKQQV
ncbi:MAG: sugar phosphate isomerase/epimerase [Granulosicoccus sp.]|nr:sugar phosphate isomerase/epimerase [Granulosicoccus sp.]